MKIILRITTFFCVLFTSALFSQTTEEFTGDTFPPPGWTTYNVSGTRVWARVTTGFNSAPAAAFINYDASGYSEDWLVTPLINNVKSSDSLIFWVRKQYDTYYPPDSLYIKISTTDNQIAGFTNILAAMDVNSLTTAYQQLGYSLAAFTDENIYIAFRHIDFDGNGLLLDDVSISNNFLPVELVSFNCSVSGNKVSLNWKTATEVNNYGFEIQRIVGQEVSGENWVKVGFVNGNGNSSSMKEYSYMDNPDPGNYSYRLKQIDNDGKYEYSSVIEASVIPVEFMLKQNYPNPFNPETNFEYAVTEAGHVTLKVFDMLGAEVATLVNEIKENGVYNLKFNAAQLPSGIYFVELKSGDKNMLRKILLMK